MIEIQIMMLVKMVIEPFLYGQERRRSAAHINGNNDRYSNRIDDCVSGNKTIDGRDVYCIHPLRASVRVPLAHITIIMRISELRMVVFNDQLVSLPVEERAMIIVLLAVEELEVSNRGFISNSLIANDSGIIANGNSNRANRVGSGGNIAVS